MKRVLGISLLLVVALTAMAFGKPVDQSHTGLVPELPILAGEEARPHGTTSLSAALFTDTVTYGGTWWAADSARWEAIRDSCWMFESGVGSNINTGANVNKPVGYHQTMEGWVGIDQTLSALPYFRRSSTCAINGSFSVWAGVSLSEANELCYAGGQGYGNSWNMYWCKCFTFPGAAGAITFSYKYAVACESGFDYAYAIIDTTGNSDPSAGTGITLATYTGVVSGTDVFVLTPGVNLPSTPGSTFCIWFNVTSDGSYSDQDGLNPTICGHSAFDDVTLTGAISDASTYEADANGWSQYIPVTGVGDYSNLVSRADLPPPAVFCPCAVQDTVLVFYNQTFGHPLDQDNIAMSPWINLKRAANVTDFGRPLRLMLFSAYAEMPIANYIFVQMRARYYPATCTATGLIYRTPWLDQNIVVYFGETPVCNITETTQIRDYSSVVGSSAEQIQISFGMLNLCSTEPFGFPCAGVTNTSPWFDNLGLGIGGPKTAPSLTLLTFDALQDNFAEDGTLNPGSTGRFDSNTIKDGSNPIPGTHLRDTLVVRAGTSTNTEVRFYFRVSRKGPFTNNTAYNTWLGRYGTPGANGFYCVRMDTAEQGGTVSAGNYMLAVHESDPAFNAGGWAGNDRISDPMDPNQLMREILCDKVLTPGTRIDYFLAARYIPPDPRNTGGTNWFIERDTAGGVFREVEILPTSTASDTSWNCTLYVDHHGDRSFGEARLEEQGLTAALGSGSANFEGTRYDRFDNETPSSGQLSLGRAIQTNYGASAIQIFAYKCIAWHAATLTSLDLTDEDANIIRPWLTIPEVGGNRIWVSGDGLVRSMNTSNEIQTVSFMQNILGVLARCNTVREAACPTGTLLDSTSCIPITLAAGSPHFGITTATSAQGNGCNALRSFDVNSVNTSVLSAKGQADYTKLGVTTNYMSVTNWNTLDVDYKTVTDGAAVGALRNTTGTPHNLALCAATSTAAVTRAQDVLAWFSPVAICEIPDQLVDVPGDIDGPKPPQFRHALGNAYPNPMNPTTRIQFTNGVENGRVTLEIFDVTGRLVKTLVNDRMAAGVHEVLWDGTSNSGSSSPSGMYFYKMTGEKGDNGAPFVSSKKLIIMK